MAQWTLEALNFDVLTAHAVSEAGIDGRTLSNMREGDIKDAEELLSAILPQLSPLERFNFVSALKAFQGQCESRAAELWSSVPTEFL